MIIEDSRQQVLKHSHIEKWMQAHGVDFAPRACALPFGDYVSDAGSNCCVDTKKDMAELASNLGKDHARFARECERARAAGYRLIILTESGARYNDPNNVKSWISDVCRRCRMCVPQNPASKCVRFKRKPMQGRQMLAIMAGMERDYGVWFSFCDRRKTAKTICELLGVTWDEPTE